MSYSPLPSDVLRVGESTPFALRDKTGILLVPRGTLIATQVQLNLLLARELYVDESDADALKRAINTKLNSMVRGNALIGQIAQARPDSFVAEDEDGKRVEENPVDAWSRLQLRIAALLRDPSQSQFEARLNREQRLLLGLIDGDPDMALLLLVQGAMQEIRDYSVTHAMLVAVVCELAARQIGSWPEEWLTSLRCAALTMNVGMVQLQNQLALQEKPLTPQQRAEVNGHALLSAEALREAGITDEPWLQAVELHHSTPAGPLAGRPPAAQIARLIQRADIFAARMSRRKQRPALPASAAAKAIYLDENQQPDEAGSAIIRAIGIYPPGCLVRLASGELGIVLRRGARANEPKVAALMNAHGAALAEPITRNTALAAHAVKGGAAPQELKVLINLETLIKLA